MATRKHGEKLGRALKEEIYDNVKGVGVGAFGLLTLYSAFSAFTSWADIIIYLKDKENRNKRMSSVDKQIFLITTATSTGLHTLVLIFCIVSLYGSVAWDGDKGSSQSSQWLR